MCAGDSSCYYSYSTLNSLARTQNHHPSSLKILNASSMSEHLLNKEEDKPRMSLMTDGYSCHALCRTSV